MPHNTAMRVRAPLLARVGSSLLICQGRGILQMPTDAPLHWQQRELPSPARAIVECPPGAGEHAVIGNNELSIPVARVLPGSRHPPVIRELESDRDILAILAVNDEQRARRVENTPIAPVSSPVNARVPMVVLVFEVDGIAERDWGGWRVR